MLGLVSYAGMMISVIRNFLHAGKKSMLVGACGFCVLAYTVNNMFSFQQVMNISTVFVKMCIRDRISRLCLAGRGIFWRPRAIPTRRASRLAEMPKSRGGRIDITCSVENILNFTIFP